MGASLTKRAEVAALRRKLAEDTLAATRATRFNNILNDNIKPSRKRPMGCTTPADPERDMSADDRNRAMAMARQRVEESPLFAGMLTAKLDHVVGTCPTLMMRTGDKSFDKDIESGWRAAKDTLDIRGVRSWGRWCRCLHAREQVDGDVGTVFISEAYKGEHKQWLQIIESDRIFKEEKNGTIDDGIDFDEYGRGIKYWVGTRGSKKKPTPYDPEDFSLYALDISERAERKRGVSAFLQLLNLSADYVQILDGIVQKVKNEAFTGLKFTMQPGGDGTIFADGESARAAEDGVTRQHVNMVPGMNLVLAENEDVEVIESKSPHAELDAFEKKLISRIVFPFGLTYELVTGDFSGINYSSARAMIEIVKKRIRSEQYELARQLSRIFQWWLSSQKKYNGLKVPKSLEKTYWTHKWGMPGFPYLNPSQEAAAFGTLLDRGLTSRTRILAETSTGDDDFDDIADELQYENDGLAERGIPLIQGNGNIATTPNAEQTPPSVDGNDAQA